MKFITNLLVRVGVLSDDLDSVITAQTIELANERNAIDIQRRRLDASALLIKASRGGWNVSSLPTFGASPVRDY